MLDAQLQELAIVARATGGKLPSEALADAERLERLVRMQRDRVPPTRTSQRWRMGALFVATLAIVSLLLLARVRETEVELQLVVSELRFTLANRQQLTESLQLASLGVSGMAGVSLPGEAAGQGTVAPILLQAADATRRGTMSLTPLVVLAGAEVTLRTNDAPNELRLSITGLDGNVQADVSGTVTAMLQRQPRKAINAATPQPVVLVPGSDDVDIDLVALNPAGPVLAPSLSITKLALVRIDEVAQDGRSVVRRVSTLHSGSVFYDDLAGRELRLRAREALRFDAARGEIRAVRLIDGRLAVEFHGRVRGMASGSLDHPRDLMPSWLEWLRTNQPLALLWGAALYLFGLLMTLWNWWKKNT